MGTAAVIILLAFAGACSGLLVLESRTRRGTPRFDGVAVLHDVHEAAFLSGGPPRVVDTALAAMNGDGRLLIGEPGIVSVADRVVRHPVQQAVYDTLDNAPNGSVVHLRARAMRHHTVQGIGDGLARRGLLLPRGPRRGFVDFLGCVLAVVSALATLVVIVATILSYDLDWDRPPVPFALLTLPATLTGLITGLLVVSRCRARVSKQGRQALAGYRKQHAETEDPATLVATKGPRALPKSAAQTVLVAAALTTVVLLDSTRSDGMAVAAPWCGSSDGYGDGGSGAGGGDGGGDGGGGDGGGGDGGGGDGDWGGCGGCCQFVCG
nr:TIGR04222 domain-containing membrane protein [Streptomyces clavuligerus]